MSYDLSVFDPDAAPKERELFIEWFNTLTNWEEDHDYDDPAVSTSKLRAWFLLSTAINGAIAPGSRDAT
jgi:hypothetical protein